MKTRNLAALLIMPELILEIIVGWKQNGELRLPDLDLPEDAKLCSVDWIPTKQCFQLVFSHPSFYKVLEGDIIPILTPEYHIVKIPVELKEKPDES